ncbi:phosphoribosylformylglycinamidine cyclo-ligase [soil metagenome]
MSELNYQSSGVDYDRLDAFKRACQREAATTTDRLALHGMSEPERIRGESAYLIESADSFLAHVEEGLGTKNLVADAMQKLTGKSHYFPIGIDTVATMVNDLITTGALPISIAMHAAVGSTDWFDDAARADDLARGFAQGCRQSNAVWGGGETPALRDIVHSSAIVLAGSAIGMIKPKSLRITGELRDGDAIVMLASSGIQTNGLTLCRALADRLPRGFLTPLEDGTTFGEALLAPSAIYVDFVTRAQQSGIELRYAVHITGHGWRKLMRLQEPFVYRTTALPPRSMLFDFIAREGKVDAREMFATFNMGAGFAVYVDPKYADECVRLASVCGHHAWIAGRIQKQGDRRAVEIAPLNIVFESETLQVR